MHPRAPDHSAPHNASPITPPNAPPDPALRDLAARLAAGILADPRTASPAERSLPEPTAVADLADRLLGLLFPGFFLFRPVLDATLPHTVADQLVAIDARLRPLIASACGTCTPAWAADAARSFLARIPLVRELVSLDAQAVLDGDPACHGTEEAILCYPGLHAVAVHRLAHQLLRLGVPLLPRMLAELAHARTGIDIHPAARIGRSFFIDHGGGTVVGETSNIGDHCKLYQGVTLGAKSFRKDEHGRIQREPKRHPTLEDHVTVYAGATILGGDTIVGAGSIVAGGVFLTESVPPGHIVLGSKPEMRLRSNPDRPPVAFVI